MRTFFLHYSLYACFLQVTMNSLGRDGIVLDILKSFDNLDCIFSFSNPNKTNGMIYVSRCYEGRTATREFSQVRSKFRANSTDGRVVDASRIRDLASGLTQIQKRNDLVDLSNRNGFHDSGSGSRVVFWCICVMLNLL